MTNQHTDEMRKAFPGVEVEQHQGDYIRRIVLPNSRLASKYAEPLIQFRHECFVAGYQDAATRYEDALREAREALSYIVAREDFSFAECSEADAIWAKASKALTTITSLIGEKK